MTIVTVPSGDFTPGAKATLDFAAALINASWDQANTKTSAFETKIDAIEAEIPEHLNISAGTATVPTPVEPSVVIPPSADVADVMNVFDTKYLELVAMLSDKFVAFRTTYFPDESAAYTAAEDWLQAAISDPSGLPDAVKTALWEDDRARIVADAQRATENVLAQFASRRYPLPPGAAANAALQIQQKSQDALAESSRKVAITSIEQLRFVVDKTLNLRQLAMTTAVEYIKALASGPDMASRLVNVGYDAQSKLISAASQFYNSRIAAAEMVGKINQYNVTTTLEASIKNQMADLQLVETKVRALVAEAETFGRMATAMFNNLHASAGTSYSGSQTSTV